MSDLIIQPQRDKTKKSSKPELWTRKPILRSIMMKGVQRLADKQMKKIGKIISGMGSMSDQDKISKSRIRNRRKNKISRKSRRRNRR